MALEDDLQEISGIGPSKAEEIVALIDEHDAGSEPDDPHLLKAIEYAEAGDNRKAGIFLRRYADE